MVYLLITNASGVLVLVISFGAAFLVGVIGGFNDEGRLMIVGGALVALLDFTYRVTAQNGNWLSPARGGMLFFIPLWILGVFWVGLGTWYLVAG
jgi:hypothetical protein